MTFFRIGRDRGLIPVAALKFKPTVTVNVFRCYRVSLHVYKGSLYSRYHRLPAARCRLSSVLLLQGTRRAGVCVPGRGVADDQKREDVDDRDTRGGQDIKDI